MRRRGSGATAARGGRSRGCGCSTSAAAGGLLSEPMARLGFEVTGIDASAKNVGVASTHASQSGLDIAYRNATVEELLRAPDAKPFDMVLNMEVVEHVKRSRPLPAGLLTPCCAPAD